MLDSTNSDPRTATARTSAVVPQIFPAVGAPWQGATQDLPNAMTCDVEDYFQVSAFEHLIDRDSWSERECRIPMNVDRILQLYDDAGVRGTFFTLGWVAKNYPEIVFKIANAGHEIASHGMQHKRVWNQTRSEFRADIGDTKKLLEDVSGQRVRGYRAASWSLDSRTPWAHEEMAEAGYSYSSSIYPISHDHFGIPEAPLQPFFVDGLPLLEIPASATRLLGRNLPSAGGGYFRLLPLPISRWLIGRVRHTNGGPAVFYFHPWELDPNQPRIPGASLKTRFRHYLNLNRFEKRFTRLLETYSWGRMDEIYLGNVD